MEDVSELFLKRAYSVWTIYSVFFCMTDPEYSTWKLEEKHTAIFLINCLLQAKRPPETTEPLDTQFSRHEVVRQLDAQ
jgi:hypothetical protein